MIAAVIPTRYHPPELAVLLDVLRQDDVQAIVLESDDHGHRIYRMWNVGMERARALGATEVAILNDDITIIPGTLPALAEQLRTAHVGVVYPDVNAAWELVPRGLEPTEGTWGAGGMTGFCFMFRASLPVMFDEGYHWWYGDDQFEADVRAHGYEVCRALGIPIRHVGNGSASKDWTRLAPLIEQDRTRWDWRHRMAAHYAWDDARRAE